MDNLQTQVTSTFPLYLPLLYYPPFTPFKKATGGHLGPNLGVVELTIAVHRAFESPRDPMFFDTGHQSYVHKILTGRQDRFPDAQAARRLVWLSQPG